MVNRVKCLKAYYYPNLDNDKPDIIGVVIKDEDFERLFKNNLDYIARQSMPDKDESRFGILTDGYITSESEFNKRGDHSDD